MKPVGPVPPFFAAQDGELAIGGRTASELTEKAGTTPLFVYSKQAIRQRMADLRAAMPEQLKIHYAVKANPFAPLLELMGELVDGFDIASAGEMERAFTAGQSADSISFAGPGKRDDELERAISSGVTLNCESRNEVHRALAIGERLNTRPKIAIRVNPDFELRGSGMKMGGGAKPFGVDHDLVPALAREVIASRAEWRGLHIFAGSQSLDAKAIIEMQGKVLDLASNISMQIGEPLPRLNLGGGFGIPYFNKDRPLDIVAVGHALKERFSVLPDVLANTRMVIELGRYLVGEAGIYLTRIIDRKVSRGTTYLVTDGGLHHQLAASGNLGAVVRRNYPVAIAARFSDTEEEEEVNIVGCLCTPLDRLADAAWLPRADVGDLVAVFCAGAYGASASPSAFLGHGPAHEMLV